MGMYVWADFDHESKLALYRIVQQFEIPNAVRPDKLHITILCSTVDLQTYRPTDKYATAVSLTPVRFEIWGTATTPCLVLVLDSDIVKQHHDFLVAKHGAKHTFSNYIPHVTLSYDINCYDINVLNSQLEDIPPLTLVGEHIQPLETSNHSIKRCVINKTVDSFANAAV